MEELNAAIMAETNANVQLWMNWMFVIFAASILFVWKFKSARWALAAFVGTMIIGFGIWKMSSNVHLLGIAHLILWTPLAIYLWRQVLSGPARASSPATGLYSKAHLFWAALLLLTIIISLLFDVRDVFLVLTGAK